MKRSFKIAAAIVVIAGVSWFAMKQYRRHTDCKHRSAVFDRQVESINKDAHARLKIGANKAEVSLFFAEHSIPFTLLESEVIGTLYTSGCAPLGCGADSALIGVRVKVDEAGTVIEEPTVVGIYTDCI